MSMLTFIVLFDFQIAVNKSLSKEVGIHGLHNKATEKTPEGSKIQHLWSSSLMRAVGLKMDKRSTHSSISSSFRILLVSTFHD